MPLDLIKRIFFKVKIYFAHSDKLAILYHSYFGVVFGKNIRFTGKNISFGSEPYLIEIGDNVTITQGVKFQTHDGGVGIFRKKYPGINVYGKIKVGDNVFIGEDAMVMYGVTIGSNVVVGAKSLVTKDVPDNVVVGGIPAKVIRTLEEYENNSLKKAVYIFEYDKLKRKEEILTKLSLKDSK